MKDQLATLRQMLKVTAAAQLLFQEQTLLAFSAQARRLLPRAEEGQDAQTVFGPAAEQFSRYRGSGSLLFQVDTEDTLCNVTLTEVQGYTLATMVEDPQARATRSTMAFVDHLRQPLTTILAMAPKLMPTLEESEDPKVLRRAGELNRSIYQMLRMVGNLDYVNEHRTIFHFELLDLELWLQRQAPEMKALCQEMGLEFRLDCAEGIYMCQVNRHSMSRAMLNLCSNAMKFSRPGGIITLSLRRSGKKIWMALRDQGRGISAEQMGRLFSGIEPSGPAPDPQQGLGLGLSIARSIIREHNGQMMLESQEGQGTTVYISLPAEKNSIQRLSSNVRTPAVRGVDATLVQLSDVLPARLYDPSNLD